MWLNLRIFLIVILISNKVVPGSLNHSVCTKELFLNKDTFKCSKLIQNDDTAKMAEKRLSSQIFAMIEHYKQTDPIGLPGVPIPDPMALPDIKQSFSLSTLNMQKVMSHGLSKFRIKHIKTDLKELQVKAGVQIDQLVLVGNYTLSTFVTKSNGPFKIIIENVFVQGNASLAVEIDGKIRTQDIKMDVKFADMKMDFQNLGLLGSIFQGIANSASNLVFDTIKPFMLKEAYTKIRTEIDINLDNAIADNTFPNSISPLDMAIAEGRKKVRNMGYDPYQIKDYNHTMGIFGVLMSNTWIKGVSSFYRVGNISVAIENNVLVIGMEVGTQEILGSTQWEINIGKGMVTRAGHVKFTVQHFKVSIEISQPLDLRNRVKLNDIQLELGNIQMRCDGAGTLDYVIELMVNIFPNLLRYQIMDALENPIKNRIQDMMDKVDVEMIIKEKILEYENLGVNMKFDLPF
uniref:CSON005147 protein n=1 Tax=Culicoides sonorensis TaxID=179676 RepID=A0A336KI47_CULSO